MSGVDATPPRSSTMIDSLVVSCHSPGHGSSTVIDLLSGVGPGSAADASQRLEEILRAVAPSSTPGITAVVLEGERAVAEAAVGVADIAKSAPATMATPYLWFSLTKVATATAVMQLVDRGLMSLDDPVSMYLAAFPRPRRSWPVVTIRHLLSHSSGLGNPLPLRWVHPASQAPRNAADFTHELLRRHRRLRFPAGSRASYSNLGYLALGEVIAAVARQPYVDYVHAEILGPLAMHQTGFQIGGRGPANPATGYHPLRSPLTPLLRVALPRGLVAGRQGAFIAFEPFCVDGPAYGGLIGPATDAARSHGRASHGRATQVSQDPLRRKRRGDAGSPSARTQTRRRPRFVQANQRRWGAVYRAPRRWRGLVLHDADLSESEHRCLDDG